MQIGGGGNSTYITYTLEQHWHAELFHNLRMRLSEKQYGEYLGSQDIVEIQHATLKHRNLQANFQQTNSDWDGRELKEQHYLRLKPARKQSMIGISDIWKR